MILLFAVLAVVQSISESSCRTSSSKVDPAQSPDQLRHHLFPLLNQKAEDDIKVQVVPYKNYRNQKGRQVKPLLPLRNPKSDRPLAIILADPKFNNKDNKRGTPIHIKAIKKKDLKRKLSVNYADSSESNENQKPIIIQVDRNKFVNRNTDHNKYVKETAKGIQESNGNSLRNGKVTAPRRYQNKNRFMQIRDSSSESESSLSFDSSSSASEDLTLEYEEWKHNFNKIYGKRPLFSESSSHPQDHQKSKSHYKNTDHAKSRLHNRKHTNEKNHHHSKIKDNHLSEYSPNSVSIESRVHAAEQKADDKHHKNSASESNESHSHKIKSHHNDNTHIKLNPNSGLVSKEHELLREHQLKGETLEVMLVSEENETKSVDQKTENHHNTISESDKSHHQYINHEKSLELSTEHLGKYDIKENLYNLNRFRSANENYESHSKEDGNHLIEHKAVQTNYETSVSEEIEPGLMQEQVVRNSEHDNLVKLHKSGHQGSSENESIESVHHNKRTDVFESIHNSNEGVPHLTKKSSRESKESITDKNTHLESQSIALDVVSISDSKEYKLIPPIHRLEMENSIVSITDNKEYKLIPAIHEPEMKNSVPSKSELISGQTIEVHIDSEEKRKPFLHKTEIHEVEDEIFQKHINDLNVNLDHKNLTGETSEVLSRFVDDYVNIDEKYLYNKHHEINLESDKHLNSKEILVTHHTGERGYEKGNHNSYEVTEEEIIPYDLITALSDVSSEDTKKHQKLDSDEIIELLVISGETNFKPILEVQHHRAVDNFSKDTDHHNVNIFGHKIVDVIHKSSEDYDKNKNDILNSDHTAKIAQVIQQGIKISNSESDEDYLGFHHKSGDHINDNKEHAAKSTTHDSHKHSNKKSKHAHQYHDIISHEHSSEENKLELVKEQGKNKNKGVPSKFKHASIKLSGETSESKSVEKLFPDSIIKEKGKKKTKQARSKLKHANIGLSGETSEVNKELSGETSELKSVEKVFPDSIIKEKGKKKTKQARSKLKHANIGLSGETLEANKGVSGETSESKSVEKVFPDSIIKEKGKKKNKQARSKFKHASIEVSGETLEASKGVSGETSERKSIEKSFPDSIIKQKGKKKNKQARSKFKHASIEVSGETSESKSVEKLFPDSTVQFIKEKGKKKNKQARPKFEHANIELSGETSEVNKELSGETSESKSVEKVFPDSVIKEKGRKKNKQAPSKFKHASIEVSGITLEASNGVSGETLEASKELSGETSERKSVKKFLPDFIVKEKGKKKNKEARSKFKHANIEVSGETLEASKGVSGETSELKSVEKLLPHSTIKEKGKKQNKQAPSKFKHASIEVSGETLEASNGVSGETLEASKELSGETSERKSVKKFLPDFIVKEKGKKKNKEARSKFKHANIEVSGETLEASKGVSGETSESKSVKKLLPHSTIKEKGKKKNKQAPSKFKHASIEVSGETLEASNGVSGETLEASKDLSGETSERKSVKRFLPDLIVKEKGKKKNKEARSKFKHANIEVSGETLEASKGVSGETSELKSVEKLLPHSTIKEKGKKKNKQAPSKFKHASIEVSGETLEASNGVSGETLEASKELSGETSERKSVKRFLPDLIFKEKGKKKNKGALYKFKHANIEVSGATLEASKGVSGETSESKSVKKLLPHSTIKEKGKKKNKKAPSKFKHASIEVSGETLEASNGVSGETLEASKDLSGETSERKSVKRFLPDLIVKEKGKKKNKEALYKFKHANIEVSGETLETSKGLSGETSESKSVGKLLPHSTIKDKAKKKNKQARSKFKHASIEVSGETLEANKGVSGESSESKSVEKLFFDSLANYVKRRSHTHEDAQAPKSYNLSFLFNRR